MEYSEFRDNVKNVKGCRKHKTSHSWGVYDAYKYIRKNKWFTIGRPLSEKEFYTIIRTMNQYIAECIASGGSVQLPMNMGEICLVKYSQKARIDEKGKLKMPSVIDWDKTLKLWYDDKEMYRDKILIRKSSRELFNIKYLKNKVKCKNIYMFSFYANRDLKNIVSKRIKNGNLDAFIV